MNSYVFVAVVLIALIVVVVVAYLITTSQTTTPAFVLSNLVEERISQEAIPPPLAARLYADAFVQISAKASAAEMREAVRRLPVLDKRFWWANMVTNTTPIPGQWTPTPPSYKSPLLPDWGNAPVFSPKNANVDLGTPPAYGSPEFQRDLEEVKQLGEKKSKTRTAEESAFAAFWAQESPPVMWNQLARNALRHETPEKAWHVLTELNRAMSDAGVVAWRAKYQYNLLRPVSVIGGDWTPLVETPPFPSCVSGHSTFSAAASAVLTRMLGDRKAVLEPYEFDSFHAAAQSAGRSRIWGGIHFSSDDTLGQELGAQVAKNMH